jgi:hypothetical protein
MSHHSISGPRALPSALAASVTRPWLRLRPALLAVVALSMQLASIAPVLAANETVSVNFASSGGTPTYRASGFIYGLSADGSQPPQNLLSDIKVKNIRAGGSQVGCPNGGFVNGQYAARWDFVRAYYARSRAVGSKFIMILAGIWGADGVCNVPRWPGDNGNWTEYTSFLTRIINDAIANGMTGPDVRWDIWNEPNIFFWGRSQAQYLEMWRRGVQQIRAAIPGAVIEGPSLAGAPSTSNAWLNTYLDFVDVNNVAPNILSWHDLPGDPVPDVNAANTMLSSRGMSVSGYSINEYGAFGAEQQPGPSAWYIARLERAGADGARANWGTVGQNPSLHQTMGWLVTTGNQPMGQWWVYKRYADQTGLRTSFTPSASVDGVVFQDSSARRSITLLGKRNGGGTGIVTVQFNNVPAYLVSNGTVNVLVERMPSTNAFVSAPAVVSSGSMAVNGTSLTISINWNNALDAYAVTLTPGAGGVFPVPGTFYRLIARHSGKAADVANCGTADGADVRQWTSLGNACQQWSFVATDSGFFRVVNRSSGKVLDVAGCGTADGVDVRQWTWLNNSCQQWNVNPLGNGFYRLINRNSGKVLDVSGVSTADGANIHQWTWLNGNNQHWQIVP